MNAPHCPLSPPVPRPSIFQCLVRSHMCSPIRICGECACVCVEYVQISQIANTRHARPIIDFECARDVCCWQDKAIYAGSINRHVRGAHGDRICAMHTCYTCVCVCRANAAPHIHEQTHLQVRRGRRTHCFDNRIVRNSRARAPVECRGLCAI